MPGQNPFNGGAIPPQTQDLASILLPLYLQKNPEMLPYIKQAMAQLAQLQGMPPGQMQGAVSQDMTPPRSPNPIMAGASGAEAQSSQIQRLMQILGAAIRPNDWTNNNTPQTAATATQMLGY